MPDRTADRSTGILLIAHGSRRAAANDDLVRLADELRRIGPCPIVEISYLELAQPDISTGGRRCVERGAREVRLLPYFLSAGDHVVRDLESHRRRLADEHPQVTFQLCPPIGLHPLIVDVVLERLGQVLHAEPVQPDIGTN